MDVQQFRNLKKKLGIYDKIFQNKSKNRSSYDTSSNPNFSSQRRDVGSTFHNYSYDRYPKFNAPKPNSKFENEYFRDRNHVTCFNCLESGHISKFCPDKHRGPKCILCENFGHKSDACPQKNIPSNNVDEITPLTTMCKEVKILSKKILSLVDTGSQIMGSLQWCLSRLLKKTGQLLQLKYTAVNYAADHVNDDHVREEKPSISTSFGNVNNKSFYDLGDFTNKTLSENEKLQILDIGP
ncbi:hypothetical protein TNCV_1569771 [Trichonephila clavipes]|uniref:CCHC-type domain-containing protein n=1 Tax=Trichonephila clavipes TaxID=2585209 RepID=A0A8X6SK06_TRICX|nr:hypothetical protein TNCV_1569771 [Trichonephila clavipes]